LNWIELIHTDENKALKLLYKSHRDDITRWLKSHYKMDENIGIDIFQQSVIILYDNVISGKLTNMSCDVKSYLFSICKNNAQKYMWNQKLQKKTKKQSKALQIDIKKTELTEKLNMLKDYEKELLMGKNGNENGRKPKGNKLKLIYIVIAIASCILLLILLLLK
jgi:hypothetical protein